MPNILGITSAWKGIVLVAGMVACTNDSLAQQPNPSNPVVPSTPPAGQFIGTITDPNTGKQYDRYLEQETVPVPRWEQQEATERRWVPHWVNENQKVTETQYVPYVEYQPRQRVINRWNPFGQPQVTWEYIPITRYRTVNQVVERPMTYQKYIEQDVKVLIPKLVTATEFRSKYVDRERTPTANSNPPAGISNAIQNAADIAMANRNVQLPRYTTRPMDGWYSGSPVPTSMNPYSSYTSLATVPIAPYYGNNSTYNPTLLPSGSNPIFSMAPTQFSQPQLVSNPTRIPPISNNYPSIAPPVLPASNAYAVNRSLFTWPSWTNSNGPLLRQDLFRQNQSTPYATQPINSTIYPTIASQSAVNGMLRPSTSPFMPQAQPTTWGNFGGTQSYRDPLQAGLPPTVLR